jgi:hypothetical protein
LALGAPAGAKEAAGAGLTEGAAAGLDENIFVKNSKTIILLYYIIIQKKDLRIELIICAIKIPSQ